MKSEPAEVEMAARPEVAWFVDVSKEGVLGRNANGTSWVFRGFYNNQQVAIKRVKIDEVEETKEDVSISQLEHKNVVKFLHVEENLFKFFILELCAASLQGFFDQDYNGPMPTDVEVLCQLSRGLDYIHSKGFIYRKVKPENILISSTTPVVMKWADFGLTKLTQISDSSSESSSCEPLCWMSPEVLSNGDGTCMESKESDIFSAGCVSFYYLTRAHPFGKKSVVKKNVMEGNPISAARLANDHFAKTVITGMIAKEPAQRITLAEVIAGLKPIPQQPIPQQPMPQSIPQHPIPQHPIPHPILQQPIPQQPIPQSIPQQPIKQHLIPQHPIPQHPIPQHSIPHPIPQQPIPQSIPQQPIKQHPILQQPIPPQPSPPVVSPPAPRYVTAADITPISGLELGVNSGTIRVKVVSKPIVGNWKKNAGFDMKFFTVLLRDDTGEIKAQAFGENFQRFYKQFKVGKEYAIKRATLKINSYDKMKELSLVKATTVQDL